MAIIKKYDPNKIYVPERLKRQIETVPEHALTIIEAPTGYGKSTSVREVLKENKVPFIWFNIDSDDKERFIVDLANRVATVSEDAARKIMAVGYPTSMLECSKIAEALLQVEFREPTVLIIDNFQYVSDEFTNRILLDFSGNSKSNLKLVCITQAVTSKFIIDLVMRKSLNYIGIESFELTKDEIVEYYKLCGVKLEENEVEFLVKYTAGWISALYLQMLNYASSEAFETTVNIDNLVSKAIWDNLNNREQDFLISMSVFENFSIRQATYMNENVISEEEIEALISKCGFIKFDAKTRKYHIHAILLYFIENEFEKLENVFKKKIYYNAGLWCKDNEMFVDAILLFHRIKDYESILQMSYNPKILRSVNHKKYRRMFIDIVENTPTQIKVKYIRNYLIFVFYMFIFNRRDLLVSECDRIEDMLETYEFDKETRKLVEGCVCCLKGMQAYNNLEEMTKMYEEAFNILKSPSDILASLGSPTFGCPSIVSMYHTKPGMLMKEVEEMETFMPFYYKLTDGKGKGQEAVMKAEALFFKGELDDAEKLCNKAVYMAETRNEMSNYLCAQLVLARIYYFKNDHDKVMEISKETTERFENSERFDLVVMNDLCMGCIAALSEDTKHIPGWFSNTATIEENCSIHNLCFANVIYSKVLLISEKYDIFESVSGQLLSTAGIFNNIIYKIYTYIYLSVVKYVKGDREKSKVFMKEAMNLSKEDGVIIPFVENYNSIIDILYDVEIDSEYREFVGLIKGFAKKHEKALKAAVKFTKNNSNFGLTNREVEVAKLAAQRLSNKEIAEELFIAESTVKSNLKVIFSKLGINSRNDLKNFF